MLNTVFENIYNDKEFKEKISILVDPYINMIKNIIILFLVILFIIILLLLVIIFKINI